MRGRSAYSWPIQMMASITNRSRAMGVSSFLHPQLLNGFNGINLSAHAPGAFCYRRAGAARVGAEAGRRQAGG